ncbi:MAG: hypothetical protein JJU45_09395 [Acidimicrobiia bacterium]|nr:hypothetical protein [Acidimicrobiia bacterium]
MSKHAETLEKLAESVLADGEQVYETVVVNYNGTVPPANLQAPSSVGGFQAAPDPDAAVTFPSARQMAILLTSTRLLVWSLGFTGKPKQFIGEVPLRAIVEASKDEVRFGGVIRLRLYSGALVDLEAHQGEPAEAFLEHLTAHLPEAPPANF